MKKVKGAPAVENTLKQSLKTKKAPPAPKINLRSKGHLTKKLRSGKTLDTRRVDKKAPVKKILDDAPSQIGKVSPMPKREISPKKEKPKKEPEPVSDSDDEAV